MMEELSIPTSRIQEMVIHGLTDVFSTMLNVQLAFESARGFSENESGSDTFRNLDETLVVGNVGFVGDISGMVYLAMPERASLAIAQRMLGMEPEELIGEHEMVNDVIGELTNMSAGGFKNQLCDAGYGCRLTIPSIIRGKYFVIEAAKTSFRQLFVFSYQSFPVTVELLMKETE
jgi:chemotaxis protein CheX